MQKLLVFSDDWGRHPSSCQHLVRAMLPEISTTWVNTIGTRPPRFDLITLRRGAEKVRGWLGPRRDTGETVAKASLPEGLTVIDSKMWPWMSHRWDRWLNERLLTRQLSSAADGATVVTTIPIVADLVEKLPAKRWVYYCVDDFSVWPGLDGRTLGRMEDELLARVDRVVAASDALAEGIRRRGVEADVLTHGVDLEFWRGDAVGSAKVAENEPPLILFWGVVDRRMNAEWLLALAETLDDGRIVLAGPQQNPDPRFAVHPRIGMPGPVPFESLPALARQASVLVMPYADLPVTRAMQPLKLKEYLATGLPVVAASLPAVRAWADCLDVADSRETFVNRVTERMRGPLPAAQRTARLRLEEEGWSEKSRLFREITVGNG